MSIGINFQKKVINIDRENDGVRIDRMLRNRLASSSLSSIYRFIRKGDVRVNEKRIKQNYRLKEGDIVKINVDKSQLASDKKTTSEYNKSLIHTDFYKRNFRILYEDESLIVCDKPAGLVVHAGTGHLKHDTLIDCAVSYLYNSSGPNKFCEPVLVHRLDRDTSGVILIAKDKRILRSIHVSMRTREIQKQYIALCHGVPSVKNGIVDISLAKTYEQNKGMKVKVRKNGVRSLSSFKVVDVRNRLSQIAIDIHTGRTHQIRVHMAHILCPIIGDMRYGDKDCDSIFFNKYDIPCRLYLHAKKISFYHPELKRKVIFTAPVPKEFFTLLNNF